MSSWKRTLGQWSICKSSFKMKGPNECRSVALLSLSKNCLCRLMPSITNSNRNVEANQSVVYCFSGSSMHQSGCLCVKYTESLSGCVGEGGEKGHTPSLHTSKSTHECICGCGVLCQLQGHGHFISAVVMVTMPLVFAISGLSHCSIQGDPAQESHCTFLTSKLLSCQFKSLGPGMAPTLPWYGSLLGVQFWRSWSKLSHISRWLVSILTLSQGEMPASHCLVCCRSNEKTTCSSHRSIC